MLLQRMLDKLKTNSQTQKTREPPEFPFMLLITKCSHVVVGTTHSTILLENQPIFGIALQLSHHIHLD